MKWASVAVAEGVQRAGELDLDQLGVDADVLEGLGDGLGDFDGLRQAGQAGLVDFHGETVLAVVTGEAGLVEQFLGPFRIVAVLLVELFGPAGVPALQGVVEDGVVHGLAPALEQLVDDLFPVDGAVQRLADQRAGLTRGVPRLGVGVPVDLALVILSQGQDGESHGSRQRLSNTSMPSSMACWCSTLGMSTMLASPVRSMARRVRSSGAVVIRRRLNSGLTRQWS